MVAAPVTPVVGVGVGVAVGVAVAAGIAVAVVAAPAVVGPPPPVAPAAPGGDVNAIALAMYGATKGRSRSLCT